MTLAMIWDLIHHDGPGRVLPLVHFCVPHGVAIAKSRPSDFAAFSQRFTSFTKLAKQSGFMTDLTRLVDVSALAACRYILGPPPEEFLQRAKAILDALVGTGEEALYMYTNNKDGTFTPKPQLKQLEELLHRVEHLVRSKGG